MRKVLGERLIESFEQALEWARGERRMRVHTFRRVRGQVVRTTFCCTGPELKALESAEKRGVKNYLTLRNKFVLAARQHLEEL